MHDRAIAQGGRLSTASLEPAGEAHIDLVARAGRPARRARLVARFGRVSLKRPRATREAGLPKTVQVSLVKVVAKARVHTLEVGVDSRLRGNDK